MAVLYIKEQGAFVQKHGERLLVTKGRTKLLDIPVIQVENIALIGNVQISTQALHMLMERGVDVSYLTYSGTYLGHTAAESSKNIFLRFEQYRFYLDDGRRLAMAKTITRNKIRNQLALIREHRWTGTDFDWHQEDKDIRDILATLENKKTPNEILGVEGMCSNIYFKAFGQMIDCDFAFNGRNRRPPRDPINVIISLAYTLLTKEMCNALDSESFEPYLGFLHGIRYGRKSLALDLIEEFRQPAVDRLVILLFNKRMIGKLDFEFPEEGRVVLTEDGFKRFCREYELWMTGQSTAAGDNFRRRIREQVASLKKAISRGEPYVPYCWEDRHVSDQL